MDEIVARFVDPLNEYLAEARASPKFRQKEDIEDVDKELRVLKASNPNSIPYLLALDLDHLGYFQLKVREKYVNEQATLVLPLKPGKTFRMTQFLPTQSIRSEWVTLCADGFTLRKIKHNR